MPRYRLLFARFPGGGIECSESVDWLMENYHQAKIDPRLEVAKWWKNDTPIDMVRNQCLADARRSNADFVLMIDNDMAPDFYLGKDPNAVPFLKTALDFLIEHPGPAVIAAPYCGPPPHENIYVFRWRTWQSNTPEGSRSLEQYSREEAYAMGGIHEAAALPTGLMLIDMRAIDRLDKCRKAAVEAARAGGREIIRRPYFYYEFNEDCSQKQSTEDVTFSRDLSLAGVPMYCAWDCWALHRKVKLVGRPVIATPDMVAADMHVAINSRRPLQGERLIDVKRNGVAVK